MRVSIPFIAGQWSLPLVGLSEEVLDDRFNPLHCGAVVASLVSNEYANNRYTVSIPFIAGQWSLLGELIGLGDSFLKVSIPFIAGQWSLLILFLCGLSAS